MRNSQVIRQWSMLKTLDQGLRHDPAIFARAYGVSMKTVRRDIEALCTVGFPIFMEYDEDAERVLMFLDKDWLKFSPDPELPDGRVLGSVSEHVLDIDGTGENLYGPRNDRDAGKTKKILHKQVAALRHTLVSNGITTVEPAPPDTQHYLCGCGHHIERQGMNGSTKVLGGKPGCPSCSSWVRNLENGVL